MGDAIESSTASDIRIIQNELRQLTEAVSAINKRLIGATRIIYTLGALATVLFGVLIFVAREIADAAVLFLKMYNSH